MGDIQKAYFAESAMISTFPFPKFPTSTLSVRQRVKQDQGWDLSVFFFRFKLDIRIHEHEAVLSFVIKRSQSVKSSSSS